MTNVLSLPLIFERTLDIDRSPRLGIPLLALGPARQLRSRLVHEIPLTLDPQTFHLPDLVCVRFQPDLGFAQSEFLGIDRDREVFV